MRECSFEGCHRKYMARGYCASHYAQLRSGVEPKKLLSDTSASERFWSHVTKGGEGECWEWMAGMKSGGYGVFATPHGGTVTAHRFAFEDTYGYSARVVDHRCRNRTCVNPAHLQDTDVQGNAENVGIRADNTSGYRGVSFHKATGKWMAYGSYRGVNRYLGVHETPEEASEVARKFRLDNHTNNLEDRK